MSRTTESWLRRVRSGERGQVLIVAGVAIVVLMGFTAFSVDVAWLTYAQRTLQATTDAAATAAAYDLPNVTNASTRAHEYSAEATRRNFRPNLPGVVATTTWGCDTVILTGIPCAAVTPTGSLPATANYFQVTQQVTVPLRFARVLGINSFTLRATAKSGIPGTGGLRPMNIITIVDSTQSMDNGDSGCGATGVPSQKKIDCAKFGVRNLIGCPSGPCYLDPALDSVGLMVFPPIKTSTPISRDYDCLNNMSSSDSATYNASPEGVYAVIPVLAGPDNYRSGSTLNPASNLVKAIHWVGMAGCSASLHGLEITGGQGSYWARAIDKAQTDLATLSATNQKQNVIIVLSDGDASGDNVPSGSNYHSSAQCRDGIDAAKRAADAGTWVYSIAYQASNSSNCSNDSGISTCSAMRNMAQSPGKTVTGAAAGANASGSHQVLFGQREQLPVSQCFHSDGSNLSEHRPRPSDDAPDTLDRRSRGQRPFRRSARL